MRDTTTTVKDQAVYLGATTTADGGANGVTQDRLNKAKKAYHSLAVNVWKSEALSLKLKLRLFQALIRILTILFYALCCFVVSVHIGPRGVGAR